MNYNWLPIVGSSFSDVGSQLFNWSRRNDDVDSANIGRLNAAQQNRNAQQQRQAEMDQRGQENALQLRLQDERAARDAYQWGANREDNARQFDERQKLSREELKTRLDADKANRKDRFDERSADRAHSSALSLIQEDPFADLPSTIVSRLDPSGAADVMAMQPVLQRRANEDYKVVTSSIEPANAALRQKQLARALEGVTDEKKIAAIKSNPTMWPVATQADADAVLTDLRSKLGRLADKMEFKNGSFIPNIRPPGKKEETSEAKPYWGKPASSAFEPMDIAPITPKTVEPMKVGRFNVTVKPDRIPM